MKAQVLLTTAGAKHLIAKALIRKIDFSKRVYVAYGTTNMYLLHHLGIEVKKYYAGFNGNYKLNVNEDREKIVILENKKPIDVKNFEIEANDYFIKGANALWYENNKKQAAVLAADKNGGTFGNFYIKVACRGSKIIIPVGHEKLIPFYTETSQNVAFAMGSKVSLLRFFSGDVYTEIEAFKDLFDVDAKIIASGGIFESKGAVVFEIDYKKEAIEFIEKYNKVFLEENLL